MGKGANFERDTCRQLSLWWTEGGRDDVFWRTAGSGARATSRGKAGRSTYGQYGDIQAVDPIGAPLLRMFTFELKKGYMGNTISDAFDSIIRKADRAHPFVEFLQQAYKSSVAAGSASWALIHRRDNRHTTITLPFGIFPDVIRRLDHVTVTFTWGLLFRIIGCNFTVCQVRLEELLEILRPQRVRAYLDELELKSSGLKEEK